MEKHTCFLTALARSDSIASHIPLASFSHMAPREKCLNIGAASDFLLVTKYILVSWQGMKRVGEGGGTVKERMG